MEVNTAIYEEVAFRLERILVPVLAVLVKYSLGNSNLEIKRWKKFLQGSGMVTVPNSDTVMRLLSSLAWWLVLDRKRLL